MRAPSARWNAVAVVLLLAVPVVQFGPAAAEPAVPLSTGFPGVTWGAPQAVTNDTGADHHPQLAVTQGGDLTVVWKSPRSGSPSYWFSRIAENRSVLRPETFLTDKVVTLPSSDPVVGPQVAVALNGTMNVVWDDGYNISFARFGPNGSVEIAARVVGPTDSYASSVPSVAVASDGQLHIAHLECRFRCTDVAYDKLDESGSDVWITRVVSSDVAPVATVDRVFADPYSGNILFTYNSYGDMWLSRFNKYGTKDMASVKIGTDTTAQAPPVAETSDGSIHVSRVTAGALVHMVVNATGQIEQNGTLIPMGVGYSPKHVQLISLVDGRVLVAWDALTASDGRQVFLSTATNVGGTWTFSDPLQFTNSSGEAVEPALAQGPDGRIHVAWADSSSGNFEIMVTGSYSCGGALVPDAQDLQGSLYIPAGQARTIQVEVQNTGDLPINATLALNRSALFVSEGWNVTLSTSGFSGLAARQSRNVTLTVRAPTVLATVPLVSYQLSLTTGCLLRPVVTETFIHGLSADRALGISGGPPSIVLDPGGEANVTVHAANNGNVLEPVVLVAVAVGSLPDGVTVAPEARSLPLLPGDNVSLNFTVRAAQNAAGGTRGVLQFAARSQDGTVASTTLRIDAYVQTVHALGVTAVTPEINAAPGDGFELRFIVEALGNSPYPTDISFFAGRPPDVPVTSVTVSPASIQLAGGDVGESRLYVLIPTSAPGGIDLDYCLIASALAWGVGVTTCTRVHVEAVHDVAVTGGGQLIETAEGAVERPVVGFTNNGNMVEEGPISIEGAPPSWGIVINGVGSNTTYLTLHQGESETLGLTVAVPHGVPAGPHPLNVVWHLTSGRDLVVQITFVVAERHQISASCAASTIEAVPGEPAAFIIDVQNLGNVADKVRISGKELPAGVSVKIYDVSAGRELIGDGASVMVPVELAVGGSALFEVDVTPPVVGSTGPGTIDVAVVGLSGTNHSFALTVVPIAADFVIEGPTLRPASPALGDEVALDFRVANNGSVPSHPGKVLVFLDGEPFWNATLPVVAPGASHPFSVSWTATPGNHSFRVWVGTADRPDDQEFSAALDRDWTNNDAFVAVTVEAPPPEQPSPSAGAWMAVVAVAGMALWRRRRLSETRK